MCEECRRREEKLERDLNMIVDSMLLGRDVTISFPTREHAEAMYEEARARMDDLLRSRL